MISRSGHLYRTLRSVRSRTTAAIKGLRGVHPTASIHRSASTSSDLVVDEYAYIGPQCSIAPMTQVGAYTMLAPKVAIVGGDHVWDVVGTPIQFTGRPEQLPTVIGRDAWIGYGAIVARGVSIGEGSIVGAGSVVTRDVPAYEIWAGVPARKLRDRFTPEEQATHRAALDRGGISPRFAEPQSRGRA